MLFNSFEFLLFLPAVFILYWFVARKSLRLQNVLILVASYVFYGWWDYRFLALIALSTVVDYVSGLSIERASSKQKAKRWLWVSMVFNLGLLGIFKYYNFFIESWVDMFSQAGYQMDTHTLQIILPVGISFYTFQTMSYSIDIYRGKIHATKDFIGFAAFVSFFPQLVAGPIERASNLLPQILKPREFSYDKAVQGLRQILWGLFKKVVIADSLAPMVNDIFANYETYSGGVLILGAVFFAFQIYGDFSGYSDIAIGTAKLFGFSLMTNFNYPYFARNIGEFWRRWHISLSTWFRDYLYIPLGGSKVNKTKAIRNVFIVFLVSGFWHGANWTFIAWGLIHAILFLPSFILKKNRKYVSADNNHFLPSGKELLAMLYTFSVVTIAWVFFRADSVAIATDYIGGFIRFDGLEFTHPQSRRLLDYHIILILFVLAEFCWYRLNFKLPDFLNFKIFRYSFYSLVIFLILIALGENKDVSFIYFQF
jgi:alginate O-acetyltransferase complex protein AlgI